MKTTKQKLQLIIEKFISGKEGTIHFPDDDPSKQLPGVYREKIKTLAQHDDMRASADLLASSPVAGNYDSNTGFSSDLERYQAGQTRDSMLRYYDDKAAIPALKNILGNTVDSMNHDLLKKIYKSTKIPGNYEIWIYDLMTGQDQPDEEPKDVVLEKLKKGDYIIYSFGTERYAGDVNITHQDFTDFQTEISRVLPLPSDYYIFKVLTNLRPDINVWNAN